LAARRGQSGCWVDLWFREFVLALDSNIETPCTPTQAVVFAAGGFNKPIDVRFHGSDMFIVDFGIFAPAPNTPNSGKIWKVTNIGQ
jgi:hypothetical protein